MLKTYEGYATPGGGITRFSIDWYCPRCESPNVDRDPEDRRELHWCDGGPSTEDDLRVWLCADCGTRTPGRDMRTDYLKLPLTPDEERQENIRLDISQRHSTGLMARLLLRASKEPGET